MRSLMDGSWNDGISAWLRTTPSPIPTPKTTSIDEIVHVRLRETDDADEVVIDRPEQAA